MRSGLFPAGSGLPRGLSVGYITWTRHLGPDPLAAFFDDSDTTVTVDRIPNDPPQETSRMSSTPRFASGVSPDALVALLTAAHTLDRLRTAADEWLRGRDDQGRQVFAFWFSMDQLAALAGAAHTPDRLRFDITAHLMAAEPDRPARAPRTSPPVASRHVTQPTGPLVAGEPVTPTGS